MPSHRRVPEVLSITLGTGAACAQRESTVSAFLIHSGNKCSRVAGVFPQKMHFLRATVILLVVGYKKTQKTPKGYTIPVPTRQEVEDALDKMAKPKKPSVTRRRLTL